MQTPICDFVNEYVKSGMSRLHMPGHKGRGALGFEALDITEIKGADALYEADGIIAQSEMNASSLFGSGATYYSAGGSSQCVKAMLCLAMQLMGSKTFVAARNVHKSFVHGCALLDANVHWLYSSSADGICSCMITPEQLDEELTRMAERPAAVYVTSPDYLGNMLDIKGLAEAAHRHGTLLIVDNAHGAYLHFLDKSLHPMDLGADMCCDSAHKTLPVLTGGAYLHIHSKVELASEQVRRAMSMFGSTSPSYLIMQSLDLCNRYLSEGYRESLAVMVRRLEELRLRLRENGWQVLDTDPLKVTIVMPEGILGEDAADMLRRAGGECEYADPDYLVLMLTPENAKKDIQLIVDAFGVNDRAYVKKSIAVTRPEAVMSIREAALGAQEVVSIEEAEGKICAAPTVACPPAIPIVVSGERIGREAIELMKYYGIKEVAIMR